MNPQHIHGARGSFEQPGTVYVCDAGHGCELTGEGGAPGIIFPSRDAAMEVVRGCERHERLALAVVKCECDDNGHAANGT